MTGSEIAGLGVGVVGFVGLCVGGGVWMRLGSIQTEIKNFCKRADEQGERITNLEKTGCPMHPRFQQETDRIEQRVENLEAKQMSGG